MEKPAALPESGSIPIYWGLRPLAVVVTLAAAGFLIYTWVATRSFQAAITPLFFLVIGGILWLFSGSSMQFDTQAVTLDGPNGRYQIRWEDVRTVKNNGPYIALEGDERRLVVPLSFAGPGTRTFLHYLDGQVSQRRVPVIRPAQFPPKNQNTRVR